MFALHAVPCRQMGPTWIGRLDAFVTENCGGTKRFDPSEHVTVVPVKPGSADEFAVFEKAVAIRLRI